MRQVISGPPDSREKGLHFRTHQFSTTIKKYKKTQHVLVPLLVYLNRAISTNINNKTNYFTEQHFSNTLDMNEHVFFTCFTSFRAKQAWLENLEKKKKNFVFIYSFFTGSSQCFLSQKLLLWAFTEETRSIDRETKRTAKTQKPALGVGARNTSSSAMWCW